MVAEGKAEGDGHRTAAALLLPAAAPAIAPGDRLELLGAQPRLPDRSESEL